MQKYLETTRLDLREFHSEDTDLLVDLDSDPEVMKFLTEGKPTSRDEAQKILARVMAYPEKYQGKLGVWCAEEKSSGEFMGWFHLRPDKKDPENLRDLELGYRLKRKFWGKGHATETSLKLIEKAFSELNAETVFAVTALANLASQSVMIKIGMIFETEYRDESLILKDKTLKRFRLTRADWISRQRLSK